MAQDERLGILDMMALDVEDLEIRDQLFREFRKGVQEGPLGNLAGFVLADDGRSEFSNGDAGDNERGVPSAKGAATI